MKRVFVSLGNSKYNFDRLLNLIANIDSSIYVTVQMGYAEVPGALEDRNNTRFVDFLSSQEFKHEIMISTHCIGHAGVGFISSCIETNRKPAVMCRIKKHNEHLNDHQLLFARAYESDLLFDVINDMDDLYIFLETREPRPSRKYINNLDPIINFLNKEICK